MAFWPQDADDLRVSSAHVQAASRSAASHPADARSHDVDDQVVPDRSLGRTWRLGATAFVSGCGVLLILIVSSTGIARSVAQPTAAAGRVKTDPWSLRTKLQFRLSDGVE